MAQIEILDDGEELAYLTDEDFANLPNAEQERVVRLESLQILREHYPSFIPFLRDVMQELGFSLTKIQASIGEFLANGGKNIMVQAQRSQAKTTIAAALCVYVLIFDPANRILILSAGGSQAADISRLVVQLINTMDCLECLRPDRSAGDRVSTEKFDVHYSLRKLDKSASVSCCGITSNLQGKRADTLLADDVESQKNSLTALAREQLVAITKDFASICQNGRIIYLGTPQSSDSIYNTLPARGYTVRIWPGRFPTQDQLAYYGDALSPDLLRILKANPQLMHGGGVNGDQGQPIDPALLGEEVLQSKELDQGPAWFQLQHMLNTRLMDADRFPLRTDSIITMPLHPGDDLPLEVRRGHKHVEYMVDGATFRFATPNIHTTATAQPDGVVFYIDPAGGGKGRAGHGGDETGWACTAFLNSNVYLLGAGGVKGGYEGGQMQELADLVMRMQTTVVKIEKNYGHGALTAVLTPILRAAGYTGAIEEDYVHGQKEVRIIDVLEPVISRGSLVIAESICREENRSIAQHPSNNRKTYSLFHQINHITRDRDALIHDDRLDAVAGAVNHWVAAFAIDQNEIRERAEEQARAGFWADPLGHNRIRTTSSHVGNGVIQRRRATRR